MTKTISFVFQRSIQAALQHVRHMCTESQKKKFMDLFALADSDSEDETPQLKSSHKGSHTKCYRIKFLVNYLRGFLI